MLRAPSYNPTPLRSSETQIRPRGRWIDHKEVAARMGVSVRTLYRRRAQCPDFPTPTHVAGHPRFNEAEIDEWMRKC